MHKVSIIPWLPYRSIRINLEAVSDFLCPSNAQERFSADRPSFVPGGLVHGSPITGSVKLRSPIRIRCSFGIPLNSSPQTVRKRLFQIFRPHHLVAIHID